VLSKAELVALAEAKGIDVGTKTKGKLVAELEAIKGATE
jgi:hypothetical protein